MARPRLLPIDDVLKKAKEVFWQHGYAATSMSDVYSATGLKPGSLYALFKDKEELFRRVLETYAGQFRASLPLDRRGLPAIEAWLRIQATLATEDPRRRGCLLINTITERTAHSPATQEMAMGLLAEARTFFRNNLEQAIGGGDLSPSIDIEAETDALVGTVIGIMGLARAGSDEAVIWNVALAPLRSLSRFRPSQSEGSLGHGAPGDGSPSRLRN